MYQYRTHRFTKLWTHKSRLIPATWIACTQPGEWWSIAIASVSTIFWWNLELSWRGGICPEDATSFVALHSASAAMKLYHISIPRAWLWSTTVVSRRFIYIIFTRRMVLLPGIVLSMPLLVNFNACKLKIKSEMFIDTVNYDLQIQSTLTVVFQICFWHLHI